MRITNGTVYIGKDDHFDGPPVHIDSCCVVLDGVTEEGKVASFLSHVLPDGSSVSDCSIYTANKHAEAVAAFTMAALLNKWKDAGAQEGNDQ